MSQKALKQYLAEQLKETHNDIVVDDGFVYAQGEFPVLLVAHMDTVHDKLPQVFVYDEQKNAWSSPQGIGGDDRCGIYMVLEVIRRYNCSVLFCEDEEIGAVGADKFTQTELAESLKFNYIIEFDRRGSNDAVFYDCDNPEFEKFITKEFYQSSWGSFSDISVLAPALGCAAVNLSCGYHSAHTKSEYIVWDEMENSINEACKILERTTEADKFEYIEAKYYSRHRSYAREDYYDDFDYGQSYSTDLYYVFEYMNENKETEWWDTEASCRAEAIGQFCIAHPNIPYVNVLDIWSDFTH